MRTRHCVRCQGKIDPQRIEALPETMTCVACSLERSKTVLDVEIDEPSQVELYKAVCNQGD